MLNNIDIQKDVIHNNIKKILDYDSIIKVTSNVDESGIIYFNGDIRSVSNNQLKKFTSVIVSVSDYTKDELINIKNFLCDIDFIYIIKNVYDIAKIRIFRPKIIIISKSDNINTLILKMNIDWKCELLFESITNSIDNRILLEYGFSGIYCKNKIILLNTDNNYYASNYLELLYTRKSSIRPLLKASGITNIDEVFLCIENGIDMLGFLFDKINKDTIIQILKQIKNINITKALEVKNKMLIDSACSIIENQDALCIENQTNISDYIANSYKLYNNGLHNKNTLTPCLVDVNNLPDKINNTTLWLAFAEGRQIEYIIKQYNIELISFNIKKYNNKEKLIELKKIVKYK